MLTEKTFDTGTVKINYAEGPPHGRPLILIHGSTLRWQDFLSVLSPLSFRYHLYAIDLRGHGLSGRAPGAYRFSDYAEDVVRFLRQTVKEPAVLLGHSLGGAVAAQAAAEAQDLTYALVLEEPAEPILTETWRPNPSLTAKLGPIRDLLLTEPSLDDILSFLTGGNPQAAQPWQLAWAKSMHQTDPETVIHILSGDVLGKLKADRLLPRITCPVLFLQGNIAHGGMVEDQHVQWARARLARCTHVYLPDAQHNVHRSETVAYCRIVMDFLESL